MHVGTVTVFVIAGELAMIVAFSVRSVSTLGVRDVSRFVVGIHVYVVSVELTGFSYWLIPAVFTSTDPEVMPAGMSIWKRRVAPVVCDRVGIVHSMWGNGALTHVPALVMDELITCAQVIA